MAIQKFTKLQGDIYYIETLWQMQKLKIIIHTVQIWKFFDETLK